MSKHFFLENFNLSSWAFWDYENEIWPCTKDKLEHCDEFVDGKKDMTSSAEVVA